MDDDFYGPVRFAAESVSPDSGSLVIDNITAGGKLDAPVAQRIFWATMEGLIAGTWLFGDGDDALGALQAAAFTVPLRWCFLPCVRRSAWGFGTN